MKVEEKEEELYHTEAADIDQEVIEQSVNSSYNIIPWTYLTTPYFYIAPHGYF